MTNKNKNTKYKGFKPAADEVEIIMDKKYIMSDPMARTITARLKQEKMIKSLGSSRVTSEISNSIRARTVKDEKRRDGLFAIVMPSGGGKTTLSKLHGLLDIDELHPEGEVSEHLMELRHDAVDSGNTAEKWRTHNDFWFDVLRSSLDGYNFTVSPAVILVHSVECALAIGAKPLATIMPSEQLHRKNLEARTKYQRALAITNWTFCKAPVDRHRIIVCDTHEELGLHVAARARVVSEILAPMLWDSIIDYPVSDMPPKGYRDVDESYLIGDLDSVSNVEAIELFKNKRIPRICLSKVMNRDGDVKFNSEDTAWCRVEWMRTNCVAKYHTRRIEMGSRCVTWSDVVDPETDWYALFPPHSKINMQRANITLRSLFGEIASDVDSNLLSILNSHIGDTHGFITSLVSFYLGIVMELRDELYTSIIESGLLFVTEEKWIDVHKEIHAMVRVTKEFNGIPLTDDEYPILQYTNTLVGRKTYTIDPEPEIKKRRVIRLDAKRLLKEGEWSQRNYIDEFEKQLKLCTQQVVDGIDRLPYTTFLQFLRKKYQVVTKGGLTMCPTGFREPADVIVHLAFKLNDMDEGRVSIKAEPNKKSSLEDSDKLNMLLKHIFEHEGYNDTNVATKPNESGKERLLLPGSFQHFLVVSYILHVLEGGSPIGCVMVNIDKGIADAFQHHDRRLHDNMWKFMYDFPDHNAYHSVYEMQAVMGAHGLFAQTDTDLAKRMVTWVLKSFENMKICGESVNSGLYSGWRCTSWVNTVLNHVYIACAVQCFVNRFGYNPIHTFQGTGDDVDITMSQSQDAYRMYQIMIEMGYEENEIKQLVTQDIHEFMRMIYTKNRIFSCVNRALPGFVCGDLERSGASPEDALKSGYINIAMLRRRGLSPVVCSAFENCVIKRYGRYKGDDGEYKPMSKYVIHGHIDDGGLGIPDGKGNIWRLKQNVPQLRSDAIRMKAQKCDMTRDAVMDGLNELEELGIPTVYDDGKVAQMAMDSISMESVNRAMVDYLNADEFKAYWEFSTDIVAYDTMEDYENYGELNAWLMSMDSGEADVSYRAITNYDRLCVYLPFSDTSSTQLAKMLSSSNGYNYVGASSMKVDQRYANLVPEWANSSIVRYCRHRVLCRSWTKREAEHMAKELLCTYSKIYRFND